MSSRFTDNLSQFHCVTCGVLCDVDDEDVDVLFDLCANCDLICEENGCDNGVGLRDDYDRDQQTCAECGMMVCTECTPNHHEACLLAPNT